MQSHSQAVGISAPFDAYSGEGPYSFVSYAHADKVVVFNAMRKLHQRGANIWYDEGIKPAGEWVEEIANAIKGSSLFIVFISPRSVDSRYVRSEVGYALSENKEILTVFVEETTLPAGLALCLQQFQSIILSEENWMDKALEAVFEKMDAPVSTKTELVDSEDEVVDHGKILWGFWEKSRESQLARWKEPLPVTPKSSSTKKAPINRLESEKTMDAEPPAKVSSPTRHPIATKVEVVPEPAEIHNPGDLYKDDNAGDFSWIPRGEISLKVPYSEETKLVRVKNGFWMSRLLITQDLYSRIMGNNPSHYDPSIRDSVHVLPVIMYPGWMRYPFAKLSPSLPKARGGCPISMSSGYLPKSSGSTHAEQARSLIITLVVRGMNYQNMDGFVGTVRKDCIQLV